MRELSIFLVHLCYYLTHSPKCSVDSLVQSYNLTHKERERWGGGGGGGGELDIYTKAQEKRIDDVERENSQQRKLLTKYFFPAGAARARDSAIVRCKTE